MVKRDVVKKKGEEEEEEEEKASSRRSVSGCRLRNAVSGFSWASFSALLGTTVDTYACVPGRSFHEPLVSGSHVFGVLVSVFGDIWKNSTHFLRPSCCMTGVLTASFARSFSGFAAGFGTECGTNCWMKGRSVDFGTESGADYWKVYSSCGTACRWFGTESGADYWKVYSQNSFQDGVIDH